MAPFTVPIRPRYSEVDGMGIVYHANYLVYFDIGRTEFLRAAGSDYARLEHEGYRLVVVDAAVQYLRPSRYDENLSLGVTLTEIGKATLTFRYELHDQQGELRVSGHTRLGCLDARQRPTRLPAATLACLRRGMRSLSPPSEGR